MYLDSRYHPYPEFVERELALPYDIRDSTGRATSGSVDMVNRKLYVPLSSDGRPITRHELGHVWLSPPKLPEVDFVMQILLAVEDTRVNQALARCGVPVHLDPEQLTMVSHLALCDLKSGRGADFTLRWVAALGTNAEGAFRDAAADAAETGAFAGRAVAGVRSALQPRTPNAVAAPFEATLEAAEVLARRLRARGAFDPSFSKIEIAMDCCRVVPGDRRKGHRLRDPFDDAAESLDGSDGVGSGFMETVEAPLTHPRKLTSAMGRGWSAATEGSHLGAIHRWALDKAIFRRPRLQRGGSTLIDSSGSMCFDADDLERIVDASGGSGVIAMYSGRGKKGQLRIVARDGRRAAAEHLEPFGSGNIVDAPALTWLARQPAPRVWISDAGVTGIGDDGSDEITRRCREICHEARVYRFRDAKEAALALQTRNWSSARAWRE